MTDEQRVKLGLSRPFECEAELVGGPNDGLRFTMVRRTKAVIGTLKINDGKRYRLVGFKNGVAMFRFAFNQ